MKAEEVIKKHVPSVVSGTQVKKYADVTIIEMMKEYARQKCKEQRELCASAKGRVVSEIKIENGDLIQKGIYRKKTEEDILNAPEPKLD